MKNITGTMIEFSQFLNRNWELLSHIDKYDTSGSLLVDWMQANWEILVEGRIGFPHVFLEPYGDGADCNGESSRVFEPTKKPTHCVKLKPNKDMFFDLLNKQEVSGSVLVFDRFVSMTTDGWYQETPPFDKILVEHQNTQFVVDVLKVDFFLVLNDL